ncbi:Beta-secretase 2 [Mortierella hygrophila]|uniref:Beta-secretase 2 n=1 Tax=Mortierella hygrophila TaxID=979708 RepID=A0A9P6K803_9FUNG|nr:Beta-secretase 2 [Mortierella hygrophila]
MQERQTSQPQHTSTSMRQHTQLRRITRLSLALCLFLTLSPPSSSGPLSSNSILSPIPLCFAAPATSTPIVAPQHEPTVRELAFWTPITDALGQAGTVISSIFHKGSSPSPSSGADTSPAIGATTVTATTAIDDGDGDDDVEVESGSSGEAKVDGGGGRVRVVASADDYGVAHLDLEGDPNCDYTTKVQIAGSEYNVIIDTGSAHFAVASDACKDCIIQRRGDHFRPNEEEEIPIDADVELANAFAAENHPASVEGGGDQQQQQQQRQPWNLFKVRPNNTRPSPGSSSPVSSGSLTTSATTTTSTPTTTETTTTTTATLAQSSLSVSSVSSSSSSVVPHSSSTSPAFAFSSSTSSPSLSTSAATASSGATATHTPVTTSTSVAQYPTTSTTMPSSAPARGPAQDAFHINANLRFPDNKDRLKKLQDEAQAAIAAVSVVPPIVPAGHPAVGGNHQSPLSSPNTPERAYTKRRMSGEGRVLMAAPAENLYPLSVNARDQGESIRVSYGIKTHSVGWSGVMTSDLMTLDMAKVTSGVITNITAAPSATTAITDAPGTQHLEDGGTMEKETNVGFAAIVENTGFFSQECGAQHGIWGLGYRTLSVDRKPTLFDTLSASMKIPNGFAIQLCGRVGNTTKTGNMFLGGYSSSHLAEPMQFVPLVKRDWYQVRLDGFKVMGQPVHGMQNLNLPKTIVDSGTTNILMSHYNLQFLIDALAQSGVVQWSSLIPEQDVNNFWFRNAVLRLPRSSFRVATMARAVEVVMSGVAVPIYTSSFLRIKPVPSGQAPEGYVDFWWHGFASSTASDAVEAERASGGAVMPGAVGTILGETLFAGKVVYFERGNENVQQPGEEDFGRIGFGRGRNCFAPADHRNVDVLASGGQVAVVDLDSVGPVRVAATSEASGIRFGGNGKGLDVHAAGGVNAASAGWQGQKKGGGGAEPKKGTGRSPLTPMQTQIHIHGLDGPIRLMGGAAGIPRPWGSSFGFLRNLGAGLLVAYFASAL